MYKAVIGLGFGDEGKGLTTDFLCSKTPNPLVIRYSGGHQAGHTVYNKGIRHTFSNFGSGSISGADTYWSKYCTVNPISLMKEYKALLRKGVNPILYIDDYCPITTPFDVDKNRELEQWNEHGSCGVGFGATIEREEKMYSLCFMDLYYPFILNEKLKLIGEYYQKQSKGFIEEFLESVSEMVKLTSVRRSRGAPDNVYTSYIFESSQGLMLDQDIGFFPHVTRSNVGSSRILEMGVHPEVYLVTRAYQTRHGNGAMSNEGMPHNILYNPEETNITNAYQGEFRRSLLDLSLLKYAIEKDEYVSNNPKNLIVTCMDHIVDEYRLTYDGELKYFMNEQEFLLFIKNTLNINHLYTSHSPETANIKEFKP